MLRRIVLASAGAVALAGSAFAADLPSRAPPPVYAPPPPFSWTGLYIGGQVGYAFGSVGSSRVGPAGFDFFYPDNYNYDPQGVIGGAHVGYNLQIGQWLLGLEGDVDGTGVSRTFTAPLAALPFIGAATVHTTEPVQGSIRLRAGLAWDRALLYATGGAAFTGVKSTYTSFFGVDTISKTRAGWTVGGGIEYAITDNWSIRGEYRYADFGRYNDILVNSGTFFDTSIRSHLTENRVQIGFSYKFGAPPAPVVAKY